MIIENCRHSTRQEARGKRQEARGKRQEARGKRQEARGKSKEVFSDFTFLYTVWFYCVHLLRSIFSSRRFKIHIFIDIFYRTVKIYTC
ncbi:CsbD family protein [Dolichospermum sp. UHCC 0260]|nr:CsbD family protein [Dolichospermum sp. UHCC 0260]